MTESQIETQIKKIVFKYFPPTEYKVFLFGSRAGGRSRRWSDWDIGVKGSRSAPMGALTRAEEELENSDIPVNVEVTDFNHVDQKFARLALSKTIPWNTT